MRCRPLNIRHGNGVSIVVRARESLVHGEGRQPVILIRLTEFVRDKMRNPEKVLNSLSVHSREQEYKYERIYRILFNPEMYYVAYQRIGSKPGNMTSGSDNETIDGMSLKRIEDMIGRLRDESYQPMPSQRVYIPKKNGKLRPLGIPAINDKLVQEVVRMILEAIYEPQFSNMSHGFRPSRSCHTALASIEKTFCGVKWFIEGDINGFFDNISHEVMIGILNERIGDERFIRLIRKFLRAGYLEDWKFHHTYSGTPQGGIISPILANIYLDKLDKYVEEYIQSFDKGMGRKMSEMYKSLQYKRKWAMYKLKECREKGAKRKPLVNNLKTHIKAMAFVSCGDEMDAGYKRLKYVRYADDFLMGVIGSKKDAETIKEDIKKYLTNRLSLEMSDEKTLITHSGDRAKFLGYEVCVQRSSSMRRSKDGSLRRAFNKRVRLMLPKDLIKKKLLSYNAVEIKTHNGKEFWKSKSRGGLTALDDLEILKRYNMEIRGLYNYYSLAHNCCEMAQFGYIMKYGMYKTYAHKYRTKSKAIHRKYDKDGVFTLTIQLKNGKSKDYTFYQGGYKRQSAIELAKVDYAPSLMVFKTTTSLIDRLKAGKCEICGATENLVMHHVRKLGELKGKSTWEKLMVARNRKTIAICSKCHKQIHLGNG